LLLAARVLLLRFLFCLYTRGVAALCWIFLRGDLCGGYIHIHFYIFSHFFVFACLRRELHPHEALKGGWGCSLFLWGVCMDLADLT
jgi:hypothetical protein